MVLKNAGLLPVGGSSGWCRAIYPEFVGKAPSVRGNGLPVTAIAVLLGLVSAVVARQQHRAAA